MSLEAFSEKCRAAGIEVVIDRPMQFHGYRVRVQRLGSDQIFEFVRSAMEAHQGRASMDAVMEDLAREAVAKMLYAERGGGRTMSDEDDRWFLAQIGISQ